MKKILLSAALLCIVNLCFAQAVKYQITGTVTSNFDGKALESATVYLESAKDSTLVTYTITDNEGFFELEGRSFYQDVRLNISYLGHAAYTKEINLEEDTYRLGKIALEQSNVLDEVVVRSRSPIVIKKDTIEFNVASFKTKKDANVEDFLKKLPGVEVADDGSITVNGKPVTNVMVNGKPFFGDDPTIATRNLSKEIIDKVQITDTKTKAQAFTGEEGDNEQKTINLTIREDKNKGVFGRVAAGGGTDERWEAAGMFNYFNNDRRLSVLAGGNNINSAGFSFGEIEKMFGGRGNRSFRISGGNTSFSIGGRNFGGGDGIVTSRLTGFNYADNYGKSTELSADYFLSNSGSENASSVERENFLPDRKYFSRSNSNATNDNTSHSVNLNLDTKIDSTFMINIRPSFNYSTNTRGYSNSESSENEDNVLLNESDSDSYLESIAKSFSNDLTVTKNFAKKGAYLRLNVDNSHRNNDTDDFFNSETMVYGDNPTTTLRNQFTDSKNKNDNIRLGLNYRFPIISEKLFLNLEYSYRNEKEKDVKSTFDFNDMDGGYTDFNTALSTDFELTENRHQPEIGLNYRTEKVNLRVNGSYVFRTMENMDLLRPQFNLKRDFENAELNSRLRYSFSRQKSLFFMYRINNRIPQARQLQAFTDVTDPLNTVVGNPNLVPQTDHSMHLNYNNFDFQKGTGMYFYMALDIENNNIVPKTTIDENLVRYTTYANVNGNYNYNLGGSYSKTFKLDTLHSVKMEAGLWGSITRRNNFSNDVQYASNIKYITPSLGFTYTWLDIMELRPRYRISFSNADYTIDRFADNNFVQHNFGLDLRVTVPKNLEWNNELNYNYDPNISAGFQKSAWFWNSTLSYTILKGNGTISLKAYDLLNQNTDARRYATDNYIQNSQSTVLKRYFMLGFSYKFNTLGKVGEVRSRTRFRRW